MLKRFMKSIARLKQSKSQGFIRDDGAAEPRPIAKNLAANKEIFRQVFDRCGDIRFREFDLGLHPAVKLMIVYIDSFVSADQVNNDIIKALMAMDRPDDRVVSADVMNLITNRLLPVAEMGRSRGVSEIADKILGGDAVLFIDGQAEALLLGVKRWEKRAVAEPETEMVVRGPRDGFVEDIRTNIIRVRRRIKTPRFKLEMLEIGRLTKTQVAIAYIDGLANDEVVQEVKGRIKRIDTDIILESGYIEEFIQDDWLSPFPQILSTERPDRVCAHLAEGHVAVFVDNTPFALVMPVTFFHFLQSSEDYYSRFFIGSAIRVLRLLGVNIALLLPSLYIGIISFHHEMVPTRLLLSIAKSREAVPFPALFEALLMEISFELLREAGIRLPRPIGQAMSIVGALVIGEAAVSAGLVSPVMVIVVALTAVASFTIPSYPGAIVLRLLRFPLMILAGTLGLFGMAVGVMGLFVHLCSLRSFGVPYVAPLMPLVLKDWKDFLLRSPLWSMHTRPRLIGDKNPRRMEYRQIPRPPAGVEKEVVRDGE